MRILRAVRFPQTAKNHIKSPIVQNLHTRYSHRPRTMVSDTRFDFLRSTADRLPVDVSVAYAPEGKRGPAAMHYWPPRQGTAVPPDNLLFFILGRSAPRPAPR